MRDLILAVELAAGKVAEGLDELGNAIALLRARHVMSGGDVHSSPPAPAVTREQLNPYPATHKAYDR